MAAGAATEERWATQPAQASIRGRALPSLCFPPHRACHGTTTAFFSLRFSTLPSYPSFFDTATAFFSLQFDTLPSYPPFFDSATGLPSCLAYLRLQASLFALLSTENQLPYTMDGRRSRQTPLSTRCLTPWTQPSQARREPKEGTIQGNRPMPINLTWLYPPSRSLRVSTQPPVFWRHKPSSPMPLGNAQSQSQRQCTK